MGQFGLESLFLYLSPPQIRVCVPLIAPDKKLESLAVPLLDMSRAVVGPKD